MFFLAEWVYNYLIGGNYVGSLAMVFICYVIYLTMYVTITYCILNLFKGNATVNVLVGYTVGRGCNRRTCSRLETVLSGNETYSC